ncbi:MAG: TIGR04282 family arsenosugar biosynthesis glycosyltransferase [Burkholderiales bacterium]|nr:TIGR04282 family arsenosugar biosynthesis glycosyltransferase [Burkholderiales bacterium]
MPGKNPDWSVLVFAKAPVPGAAKTRLIPLLGAAGAAMLHRRLITRALATARAAAADELTLWCAPDAGHPFLRSTAQQYGADLQVQHGADLGARMAHAFATTLQRAKRAICIGADCPALTAHHLQQAAAALRDGDDAVFVPAEDGGYALVGLSRAAPALFAGIPWGTSTVMAETRARLRDSGLRWHELETLWDIDRPQDYHRLQQSGLLDDAPSPV